MLPRSYYTLAIARALPDSFADALSHHHQHAATTTTTKEEPSFSLELARQQHAQYIAALRQVVPVLELPALPEYPDSVFVEDTVVAIGKQAVVTQPGHTARQGEVESIYQTLQQLGLQIVADMRQTPNNNALCDGGDVLYTGRHLFVGLSDRTNEAGADVLIQAFHKTVPVHVIPPTVQGKQVLHLKSAVTHIDEHTLVVPTGATGNILLDSLQAMERGYDVIRIPDILACNVVRVNQTCLLQDTSCLESRDVLQAAVQERNLECVWVNTSELAKKDAALTCCSVLLDI